MNLNEKQKKCLLYSLIINYIIYMSMRLFFYPIYECQLDEMIQAAVCGISGVKTARILCSNVLIGWLLKGLTAVLPFANWYFAFLCGCVFIALSIISYIIIKRTNNKIGLTVSAVFSAFIGYECYALPGYMKTASICGTAVLAVLADYAESCVKKDMGNTDAESCSRGKINKQEFAIGFLALLSSLFSFSVFLITAVMGLLGLGVYYAVCNGLSIRLCAFKECPAAKRLAAMAGGIFALAVLLYAVDDFSYRYGGQAGAADYRTAVIRMYGYGMGDYEDSYAEDYGIDQEEYDTIKKGSFGVSAQSGWEKLRGLSGEWKGISLASVDSYFKTVPIALFRYGIFYLFIVLLFLLFFSPVKAKKALVWAETGMVLAGFLAAYLWNAWGYNWTVFVFLLPLLMPLVLSLKGAEEVEYQHLWVYLAVLSIILYSKFSGSMVSYVSDEDIAQKFAGLDAQQADLVDLNAYLKTFSAQQAYPEGILASNKVKISNGAYALLEGFADDVLTEYKAEGVNYVWVYNSKGIKVENLVFED